MVHNLMAFIVRLVLVILAVAILLMAVSFLIGLGPLWAVIAVGFAVYTAIHAHETKDWD